MDKPRQFRPKRVKNAKQFRKRQESSSSKGYSHEWRIYRFRFLSHNPICYSCGKKATVVDHYVAAKLDHDTLFWKVDNYIPMCAKCHNTVTGLFDRHIVPKTKEKSEWLVARREENNIATRVKVVPFKKGSGL